MNGGKNLSRNFSIRSTHEVMGHSKNSVNQVIASPINENRKNHNRMKSWEMFMMLKGVQISM